MLKSNSRQTLSDTISFLCIERFPPRRRRKAPEIQQAHKLLLSESWFTTPFPRSRKHSTTTTGEGGSGQPSSIRLPSRLQRAPGCSLWAATLLGQCRGFWVIPAPVTKPKKNLIGSPSWTLVQLLLFCIVGSLSGVSRRCAAPVLMTPSTACACAFSNRGCSSEQDVNWEQNEE